MDKDTSFAPLEFMSDAVASSMPNMSAVVDQKATLKAHLAAVRFLTPAIAEAACFRPKVSGLQLPFLAEYVTEPQNPFYMTWEMMGHTVRENLESVTSVKKTACQRRCCSAVLFVFC